MGHYRGRDNLRRRRSRNRRNDRVITIARARRSPWYQFSIGITEAGRILARWLQRAWDALERWWRAVASAAGPELLAAIADGQSPPAEDLDRLADDGCPHHGD